MKASERYRRDASTCGTLSFILALMTAGSAWWFVVTGQGVSLAGTIFLAYLTLVFLLSSFSWDAKAHRDGF